MAHLSDKHCVPCKGGVAPMGREEIQRLLQELPSWSTEDDHHITRTFIFPDFVTALEFVNRAGEVAEAEGHHPDIYLTWGKVRVDIWTHKINGLTESDFILAAKIDRLY